MSEFFSLALPFRDVLVFYLVALLVGMSKTGVYGSGMMAVPMLATVFGGQASSGILLPMLCLADVMGVIYYHRHASWSHLTTLFPAAAIGIVAGSLTGEFIDDQTFKTVMAVVIVASVVLMIWTERSSENDLPDNPWIAHLIGVIAGFASMVGNLAGSVMAVYLLSMRLPKNVFIGTTAWFFLVINFFKVPFHVFHWKTITFETFLMNLSTLPVILIGGIIGIWVVKKLSEGVYRWFIIAMTLAASLFMVL
jgi:uncharacterized protein